ncbi:MAG: hypothetical protein BWY24_00022 [Microgenomates group bacterium ADurb.Bin219]|nr:MAG: hypothetical protein BWY24_00022 [Microgenomates group bacterium ADurb.Bin219]HNP89344.1 hypothetical protein [Candidatus Woesebacteria bacterium]
MIVKPFFKKIKKVIPYLLILLILLFSRIYAIDKIPWGIEGDEIQWIASFAAASKKEEPSSFGTWSRYDLDLKQYPIVFGIGAIYYKIIGYQNVLSFRYLLSFLNVISSFIFFICLTSFFSLPVSLSIFSLFAFSNYELICARIIHGDTLVNIFFLPAVYLFLRGIKNFSIINILISSFLISICLLSFNIAYHYLILFFIVLVLSCLFQAVLKKRVLFKKSLILVLVFSLFPCFFTKKWINNIKENAISKSYGMTPSLSLKKNFKIDFTVLQNNFLTFKNQLTGGVRDFLFENNNSFVPKIITILSLMGLVLGLIQTKYFFAAFIFLGAIFYHIIFGILLPRTYICLVPFFYFLAAVSLENIILAVKKMTRTRTHIRIFLIFSFVLFGVTIVREMKDFIYISSKNPAYLTFYREQNEIYKYFLSKKPTNLSVIWLIGNDNKIFPPEIASYWNMIDKFYYPQDESPFQKNSLFPISQFKKNQNVFLVLETNILKVPTDLPGRSIIAYNDLCEEQIKLKEPLGSFKLCKTKVGKF